MDNTTFSTQNPVALNQASPTRRKPEPPQQIFELLKQSVKQRNLCGEPETHLPAFWDGLSKIWLDKSALDRQNAVFASRAVKRKVKQPRTRRAVGELKESSQHIPVANYLSRASQADSAHIKALSRHGGPDLTDLKGFQELLFTSSSDLTSATTTSMGSLASYKQNFEQHLIDHGIYLDGRAKAPQNKEEIIARLAKRRHLLSLSQFSDTGFQRFQEMHDGAKNEGDMMMAVIPTIIGSTQNMELFAISTSSGILKALTNGSTVPAKPDVYYGARPEQLNEQIREELKEYIVPSAQRSKPMVPNFFLGGERSSYYPICGQTTSMLRRRFRGTWHSEATILRYEWRNGQAFLRQQGLHSNLNLRRRSTYDLQSSSSCVNRKLPWYHMTRLNSWAMVGNLNSFREGAAAFRNARDFAREQRDIFITSANSHKTMSCNRG